MQCNCLKAYREQAGFTQAALAEACGWGKNQSRICNYETGRSHPTLVNCRVIVQILNKSGVSCSLDDVFPPIKTSAGFSNEVA